MGGSARHKAATYTRNECKQTIIPSVEFEPTIPVFEREMTVHALDREAPAIYTPRTIY
jgi:hypothetical protein